MPTVSFNQIPGNLRVPFWYAEINSGGSPYEGNSRLLLMGQKLAAGTATAAVPVGPIASEREADALFGVGSMLAAMFRAARQCAPFHPIWALPLADPAGAQASGTITIDSAPAVTGAAIVRVMGRRIVFQVNSAETKQQVGTNLAAAINAAGLPVTADDGTTPNEHIVTVTARHVGLLGNTIELKLAADEPNVLKASNTTIVAMASGSGTPVLDTPLANLGDDEFDWIGGPYADTTSLDAVKNFLSDVSGRWGPMKQLYGHYVTTARGNLSTLVALGNGRNDQHVSILGSQAKPTPPWESCARAAALAAAHLTDAPELSRPLQTLEMVGELPPDDRATWWDIDDRQALYSDGVAAERVTKDGRVLLDRMVTTYQQTAAGVPDLTFLDIETMAQLMFAVRYFKSAVSNKHARQALATENPFDVDEVTTPAEIKDTLVHAYTDLVALGVAEKPDLFAEFVAVEIDPNNANRVNAFLPIDVVNQLRVFAANVTAFLNYQSASGLSLV